MIPITFEIDQQECGAPVYMDLIPTGSAVFGGTFPNDIDYLGLHDESIERLLDSLGWIKNNSQQAREEYPDGLFCAFRKGHVNLILARSIEFYIRWLEFHDFMLKNPEFGRTKELRVKVSEHFQGEAFSDIVHAAALKDSEYKGFFPTYTTSSSVEEELDLDLDF